MQPTLALQCTSLVQNIIRYLHWAWFAFCDQEGGGGGWGWVVQALEAPLFNYKTSHDTATKITQNDHFQHLDITWLT